MQKYYLLEKRDINAPDSCEDGMWLQIASGSSRASLWVSDKDAATAFTMDEINELRGSNPDLSKCVTIMAPYGAAAKPPGLH